MLKTLLSVRPTTPLTKALFAGTRDLFVLKNHSAEDGLVVWPSAESATADEGRLVKVYTPTQRRAVAAGLEQTAEIQVFVADVPPPSEASAAPPPPEYAQPVSVVSEIPVMGTADSGPGLSDSGSPASENPSG